MISHVDHGAAKEGAAAATVFEVILLL